MVLAIALAIATPAVAASPRLSEPQVRAFVERQSRAWNAADLTAYFATFSPEARFTDQALSNENKVVPYGVSTLAQARAQTRKTLAKSKVRETSSVSGVAIAPDGRSARVTANTVSEIDTGPTKRRVCALRVQSLALTPAGLRSTGQTDTIVRCRAPAIR